ncbi:glycosyltransferase family 1 protein [Xanthomonas arboricola pv. juglandis]|uniref:glycosyltransferase family protein n=1 Tax=Xanthomonas TaxID=338 RepID=UPI000E5BB104|nr:MULTISPECIES: glycosyltransferase [Xanthomonas]CAD1791839.1 glycosyltransferase family 1 protein [Xanthomonas sp. CPBF 426]CAG2090023.1 glycosyltransferase family 1 protein [Xanthomonas euroxanthea]SYZ52955.1 glycosyltransferase family 1 protein [Xanthomonas arboricola pv. juglandis]
MDATRSVLLASNYEAWPEAFNGQAYALLNVIRSLEHAQLLCPPAAEYTRGRGVNPGVSYLLNELTHRGVSALQRLSGRPALSNAQPRVVEQDHDLFFYVCQFPRELGTLARIKGWRERCRTRVVYLLETWPELLDSQKAELKLLDQFDHVFVLNASCVDALRRYTSTPVSFLASACDTLLATPLPRPPQRCIDVVSIGRRMPQVHAHLLAHAQANPDFFYLHDVLRGGAVQDWAAHRLQSAAMIKRAKFFMAHDFVVDTQGFFKGVKKQALATRYFEGAAGGAVILGSAQACPEFAQYFDWEDAVIELPADGAEIGPFLRDLEQQTERLERARLHNAVQCLRRHDWAHRWAQILQTLQLPPPPLMAERLAMLDNLATMAEQAACPPAIALSMTA